MQSLAKLTKEMDIPSALRDGRLPWPRNAMASKHVDSKTQKELCIAVNENRKLTYEKI
jgi:hypothetical protein